LISQIPDGLTRWLPTPSHSDTFSPKFKTGLQRNRTDFQGICNAQYISVSFLLINVDKFPKLILELTLFFLINLEKSLYILKYILKYILILFCNRISKIIHNSYSHIFKIIYFRKLFINRIQIIFTIYLTFF